MQAGCRYQMRHGFTAVVSKMVAACTILTVLCRLLLPASRRYDGQNPEYMVLRSPLLAPIARGAAPVYTSTLWGPTCDSADCVYKDVALPLLRNGDWLCFPNAGAYTVAGACDFNGIGMTTPRLFYVYSDHMAGREHVQPEEAFSTAGTEL